MPTLSTNFSTFKSRIEPTTEAKEKAQKIPGQIRDYLAKHPDFGTVSPHTLLAGSYARGTATKSIKDIDILVFGSQLMRDLTISDMMDILYSTLKGLPDILGEGEVCQFRRQRRSININLKTSGLQVDIVPVFATNGVDEVLEIPDREWDEYVLTHPLGYASILSGLNKEHGGKLVPLIKMFKHWRDYNFVVMKPKSYWLESLVVRNARNGWFTTAGRGDGEMIADLFDSIYNKFEPLLDDPAKAEDTPFIPDGALKNHVAWNWKRSHFKLFMDRLDKARVLSRQAVDESDASKAAILWQKVFGAEWFPSMEEMNASYKSAGQASLAGTLVVSSAGTISATRPKQETYIVAPPTRFYGE